MAPPRLAATAEGSPKRPRTDIRRTAKRQGNALHQAAQRGSAAAPIVAEKTKKTAKLPRGNAPAPARSLYGTLTGTFATALTALTATHAVTTAWWDIQVPWTRGWTGGPTARPAQSRSRGPGSRQKGLQR